jgi:hypothetical protein
MTEIGESKMGVFEEAGREFRHMLDNREGSWVQWIHPSHGSNHCDICIRLDENWFIDTKIPKHQTTQSQTRDARRGGMIHPNGRIKLTTPYGG